MSTTMDEKYTRLLIRALIMPRSWALIDDRDYTEIPYEDREKCLDAGIKRFDEIFTQNMVLKAAQGAADRAMIATAKKLQDKRLKALERIAPMIQAKIRELIQDQQPSFDLGYQVAAALKAQGYTWEQVILAKRDMKLPAETDGGIQIGYTGLYD
jgi:hypothetical protein